MKQEKTSKENLTLSWDEHQNTEANKEQPKQEGKEVKNWYSRNEKIVNNKSEHSSLFENCEMVCELKIDGNAIALSYYNGLLVQDASRADGNEVEDITNHSEGENP